MSRRKERNTKGRIITAAWKLFYEQGYEDTTVEEIIDESGTSKGSFYHYFNGKDALLSTLSVMFDEKYQELAASMDPAMNSFDKLLLMNHELFVMIENEIDMDLLARLYSTQLVTKGERHLMDHNRFYYRMLKQIVSEGQKRGQISDSLTINEIVKVYAFFERAFLYDWCLSNGEYSLSKYSDEMLPVFIGFMKR